MKEIKQDLLNVSEVKKILRIPLSTLYYLTKIGAVKSLRIGKHIRYRRTDIEYYLENGFGRPSLQTNKPPERREFPRINCFIDCIFKIALPDKSATLQNASIQNISAGGLFMHIPGAYDIRNDDPVELGFALVNEGITVSGRVVRIKENGVAVKYRNIPEETKERIIRYVG